jgi:hypothetical protein
MNRGSSEMMSSAVISSYRQGSRTGRELLQNMQAGQAWASVILKAVILASCAGTCCWGLPRPHGIPLSDLRACSACPNPGGRLLRILGRDDTLPLGCNELRPIKQPSTECDSSTADCTYQAPSMALTSLENHASRQRHEDCERKRGTSSLKHSVASTVGRCRGGGEKPVHSSHSGKDKVSESGEKAHGTNNEDCTSAGTLADSHMTCQLSSQQSAGHDDRNSTCSGGQPFQKVSDCACTGSACTGSACNGANTTRKTCASKRHKRPLNPGEKGVPCPPASNQHQHQRKGQRYWYDKKEKMWHFQKEENEDLSVESLQGYWSFPPSDCLTFRWRKPDRWNSEPFADGILGWIEFFIYLTPGLNILLKIFRGFWPCAVCGLPRSKHPFWSPREVDLAFWEAVQDRDIQLAVRLVRGGVDCTPGSGTWCLLGFIMANYCQDPYKGIKPQRDEFKLDNSHLTEKTPEFRTYFSIFRPYL